MGPVLAELKADAQQIVTTLLETPGVDLRVGIGSYRDFLNQPFVPQPFIPQLAPTGDVAALVAAVNNWVPAGGGDGSEAQLYALHRIATDPAVGFRPDAKRIVVWFGDSPGHEPVCATLVGFGTPTFEIDEALVASALQSGGPLGTTLIAIGTVTSFLVYPDALDDDPTKFNDDYEFFCEQGGLPGQATRLAAATGGVSTQVGDPSEVTDAILDAVAGLLTTADVSVSAGGDVLPFVVSVTPPSYEDVLLPTSAAEQACVEFDVVLEGPPCDAQQVVLFDGLLDALVNGEAIDSLPLSLLQPSCYEPGGIVLIGPRRVDAPFPAGGPEDTLLVGQAILVPFGHGTPPLQIPDDPALIDAYAYLQVAVKDGLAFPDDPVKLSQGLLVRIGHPGLGAPYGTGSGLALELAGPAMPGGPFVLDVTLAP
jgi:hypothetical protein